MAHRTLAELITPKQQSRLESLFRETLLETSSTEGGPQRIVEHQDILETLLEKFFDGAVKPYFMLEGDAVAVHVDYSTRIAETHKVTEYKLGNLVMPSAPQAGAAVHRLQLFHESGYCSSDKMLVRALRKAGLEHADAWDLRAFVQNLPLSKDIEPSPVMPFIAFSNHRIRAGGTQIPSDQKDKDKQRPWMATAEWHLEDKGIGPFKWEWQFSFEYGGGLLLARHIENK